MLPGQQTQIYHKAFLYGSYFLPTGPSKVFDGLGKSYIEGVGDEGVADGYLLDARKLLEAVEVVEVEVVPGVELYAGIEGRIVALPKPGELVGDLGLHLGRCIRSRVKLNAIRADSRSPCHVGGLRVHEKAHTDTFCLEALDGGTKDFLVLLGVPTVVRGNLTRFGGDESALGGTDLHDQVEEIGSGVSLDVKLHG